MKTVRCGEMEKVTSILMCPVCEGQVGIDDSSQTGLICLHCGERYPMSDGIPVMIPQRVRLVDPELVHLYSGLPARTEANEHTPYITGQVSYIQSTVEPDGKLVVDLGGAEGMLTSRLVQM